jgi:hypothetical protein
VSKDATGATNLENQTQSAKIAPLSQQPPRARNAFGAIAFLTAATFHLRIPSVAQDRAMPTRFADEAPLGFPKAAEIDNSILSNT